MATHDYVIANGTGAAVRSDLNGALAAIVSQNSSSSAPATMYAYMLWADTTAGIMKMRNGANSAWISLWELDGTFIASDISLSAGTVGAPSLYFTGDTNTGLFSPDADTVALATAGSNRLHITSAGLVGIGTSTATYGARLTCQSVTGTTASVFATDTATEYSTVLLNTATSGNNGFALLQTEATPVTRGSITYNRAGGVVAYNITSDYRSKTISGNLEDAGTTIDAFKVYRGVMNGATIERPMLVAHEAQEIAPYCVTGEKDAVDDDGNPVYQQMDHQVLVPLLIAEIQQLRIRVATLEAA